MPTVSTITPMAANNSSSSVTTSCVVASGSNRILLCLLTTRDSGVEKRCTGVTFNTTETFTLVRQDVLNSGGIWWITEVWILLAPTVTTANIVATWSSGPDQAQSGVVMQLNDASQSTTPNAHTGATGTGTTASCVLTSTVNNCTMVDIAIGRDDPGLTVGAGQTAQVDRVISTNSMNEGQGCSTIADKATAGAETMDWTQGASMEWAMSAIAIAPVGTALIGSELLQGRMLQRPQLI